jgi:formyltetrahydrofolate hydrolase
MKKFFILAVLISLSSICFADNSIRIKELQEEAQNILSNKQKYVQTVQNMDFRLAEISGAIKELTEQDKPKKESKD